MTWPNLTDAQRRMIIDSEPDDRTGTEGCGVELRTGADYAIAKALERRKLGHREGPGGSLPGMYWSNAMGLAVRAALKSRDGRATRYTMPDGRTFMVTGRYYLASCDHCEWIGSSEDCGTDSGGDDSDVYCPKCDRPGADCGSEADLAMSEEIEP